MALSTFVKISGVTNLSDARYCAGMGVDMIGFPLDPDNEKYVNPEKYQEIVNWLSGVQFVGEFNHSDLNTVESIFRDYPVDYLQISDPSYIGFLQSLNAPPLLLRLTLDDLRKNPEAFADHIPDIEYFLIEGEDESFDETTWAVVQKFSEKHPVLLGCGIQAANVHELLQKASLRGIALQGGEEIKPGLRDFDELADILETLEIDDV